MISKKRIGNEEVGSPNLLTSSKSPSPVGGGFFYASGGFFEKTYR